MNIAALRFGLLLFLRRLDLCLGGTFNGGVVISIRSDIDEDDDDDDKAADVDACKFDFI